MYSDNQIDKSFFNYLLTNEFNINKGYSYTELIKFLNTFQYYYKENYEWKEKYRQELLLKNKTFEENNYKIRELENLLKEKEKENAYLYNKITRKLTFSERITGKITIKY